MPEFAVIFDKDGVIINNNEYHKEAWKIYLNKYQLHLDDESFKANIYGQTNENILRALYNDRLSERELIEHSEEKEAIFREIFTPHFQLTKGLPGFIERLKASKIQCALATNAPQSNIDFTIELGHLNGFFKAIVNPRLVEHPKPAPDIYLKAASLLNHVPENCIVFEDSLTGIEAAKTAGMKVIAISSTYHRNELTHADWVIKDFSDLVVEDLQKLLHKN